MEYDGYYGEWDGAYPMRRYSNLCKQVVQYDEMATASTKTAKYRDRAYAKERMNKKKNSENK